MSKVYIVQRPLKVVKDSYGEVVDRIPLFDISPAGKFGEIELLLEPGDVALMPVRMLRRLAEKLATFSDEDYIVPTGDTVAVGVAVAMAAMKNNGRVKLLRWDKRDNMYTELEYNLYGV